MQGEGAVKTEAETRGRWLRVKEPPTVNGQKRPVVVHMNCEDPPQLSAA